jgi:hypothetical protein
LAGFGFSFPPTLARGVGQRRMNSVRLLPLERFPEQARGVGQWVALSACECEQPLAPVRRADFRRREESCRKAVAHSDQALGDFGKSEPQMMRDVLQEYEGRLAFPDEASDVGPQVPRVGRALALSREGERLARIARKDDVHAAAPRSAAEACNIVPDRSRIQGRVFHPGHEDGRCVGFPLDVTHSPVSADGEVQAEIESAGAGAQRESEQWLTSAASIACGGM